MWRILTENFLLLDAIQFAYYGPQIDWQQVMNEGRRRIEGYQKSYFEAQYVYDLISSVLNEFQSIGHLGILSADTYDFMLQMFNDTDGERLFAEVELLSNPASKSFYNEVRRTRNLTQRNRVISESRLRYNILRHYISSWKDNDILYLKVSSFGFSTLRETEIAIEVLNEILADRDSVNHIIVDIRGNGGGNTAVWFEGIVLPLWDGILHMKKLGLTQNGDENAFFWERNGSEEYIEFFPISAGNLSDLNLPTDSIYFENADFIVLNRYDLIAEEENPDPFNGDIWLLIDKWVYSAADQFANIVKHSNFATLVGQRAAGSNGGVFNSPFLFILPNTGLAIRYESDISFNHDGTINQLIGTPPHVEINLEEDILDSVLQIISQNNY